MAVKMINLTLYSLSKDFKIGLKDYSNLFKNGIPLKEVLIKQSYKNDIKSGRTPSKFNPDYWNGNHDFITMADIDTLTYTLNETSQEQITDEAIENEKTLLKVNENSLIISNAMTLGLSFLTDREVYINQNVFCVDINENKANKKFLLWYFNYIVRAIMMDTYSAKYLSKQELSMINIPNLDIETQNNFAEKIKSIEEKMTELKRTIKTSDSIINDVFLNYFNFNYSKFEELKKIKIYNSPFKLFGNNIDIRFSTKFHRPAGQFVMEELNNITSKKIKDYLVEPIILGKGISPKDYDDSGDYCYISMADIKTWAFNLEDVKYVSNEYSEANQTKTVKKNDIILARSGEGTIGKVALITEDIDAIFADFTMRIRLKDYNSTFAYYYFRTSYFQYLIEIYKKGLGNNTNIFPSIIQYFPIPDISLDEQEKMVDLISDEIEKQDIIEQRISYKKSEIEKILLETIKETH